MRGKIEIAGWTFEKLDENKYNCVFMAKCDVNGKTGGVPEAL